MQGKVPTKADRVVPNNGLAEGTKVGAKRYCLMKRPCVHRTFLQGVCEGGSCPNPELAAQSPGQAPASQVLNAKTYHSTISSEGGREAKCAGGQCAAPIDEEEDGLLVLHPFLRDRNGCMRQLNAANAAA